MSKGGFDPEQSKLGESFPQTNHPSLAEQQTFHVGMLANNRQA